MTMALQMTEELMDKVIEDKIEDLEIHLDALLHQKSILQGIEKYSNNRIDFGDLLETYKLLVEEIERLQQEVRRLKSISEIPRERECAEEEEEENSSFSSNKFDLKKQDELLKLIKNKEKEDKMSQEQIGKFLEKNKAKWYTSSQISQAIGIRRESTNKCLSRMKKHSEVKEKKIRVMLKGKLGLIPKEVPFYSYKRGL